MNRTVRTEPFRGVLDDEDLRRPARRRFFRGEAHAPRGTDLRDLYAESGQTLQGSLTAVSKPNFASKYSLELGSI